MFRVGVNTFKNKLGLSSKVNRFETIQGVSPRFKAHAARFTITTLALFGRKEDNAPLIAPALLEHQMHWVRNSAVLPNYMGHNVSFVKNGFFDQIQSLRNTGGDKDIDEGAITRYNLKQTAPDIMQQWTSSNSLQHLL